MKNLTPRESQVMELMCRGMSDKQISRELMVSRRTVASHASNIYRKFCVQNRAHAVAEFYRDIFLS